MVQKRQHDCRMWLGDQFKVGDLRNSQDERWYQGRRLCLHCERRPLTMLPFVVKPSALDISNMGGA